MKQVLIKGGQAIVEQVPAPQVEAGTVLVRVDHSCISVGTELSGVVVSGAPLWKRALQNPAAVKRVLAKTMKQGISRTRSQLGGRLSIGEPTGYSAAGVVLEVGEGVEDIQPGDRVACAGAQAAHHAEVIRVPRNLTVPVPDGLPFLEASTVTLGAIAMQGVRRAQPTLGETFVVVGLGFLGQLTVQFLKANGCRVIGTDLDKGRIEQAKQHGMDIGLHPDEGDQAPLVARLTDGIGADGVIITAASKSDEIVSTAFQMTRKKGRVVLVGDVGLDLNRGDFYAKEIDFLISSSYGPGRYDRKYEEEGLEYPVAFVRWTENRNMSEYLRLLAEGRVRVADMLSTVYDVDDATAAYEALRAPDRPLIAVLHYPADGAPIVRVVPNTNSLPAHPGAIRLALVGAGGFAKGMHLPNIQQLPELYQLRAVMSRTGHNAAATAKQYQAEYSTTDYAEVLRDADIDAVLVATRHDLHASMALEALRAGKHVLVEKPLALTPDELDEVVGFYRERGEQPAPVLLTGFNRRFSPFARRIAELTRDRNDAMIINYRMNAGYIPLDHWVHGPQGGGRNIGEACHIYDLFTYLTGAKVVSVSAESIRPRTGAYTNRDNFVATVRFDDGSVATLTYTALGASEFPKERMDVFVDGRVLTLDDYRELTIVGANLPGVKTEETEKGQKAEIEAFATSIRDGGEWPIPLWQQEQAMRIAFEVDERLRG